MSDGFPYLLPFLLGLSSGTARTLKQLLPPGLLWLLEGDTVLTHTLVAMSDEFERIRARVANIVEESDPRTALESLADWERVLGLPDDVVTVIPATAPARRLAIVQKMLRLGGQHQSVYIALAAACGYTVTVFDTYYAESSVVAFEIPQEIANSEVAFYWRVDVQPPTGVALSHAELEAAIRKAAPSHTIVTFNYL